MTFFHRKHKNSSLYKLSNLTKVEQERQPRPPLLTPERVNKTKFYSGSLKPFAPSSQYSYNCYFNQAEDSDSLQEHSQSPTSFENRPQKKLSVNISDLYQSNSSRSQKEKAPVPPLRWKNKASEFLSKPKNSFDLENTIMSSFRMQSPNSFRQSPRIATLKERKGPDINSYLTYLSQSTDRSSEHWLKDKQQKTLAPKKTKKEPSALELNSMVMKAIIPGPKKNSKIGLSLDLKIKKASNIQNTSEYQGSAPTSIHSIKKEPSPPKRKSNFPGFFGVKETSTRTIKTKKQANPADSQILFKDIAVNMHDIYKINLNERRFLQTIEALADYNEEVLKIVLAKSHKVYDYDPVKLENKFSMIEIVYEPLSIPVRLQKLKEGSKLVEASLIPAFQIFNHKLEDYIIKKRNEALKLVESSLEESKLKLEQQNRKKANDLIKKGKVEEYFSTIKETMNDNSFGFPYSLAAESDPTKEIDKFQRNALDYKHLKRRNLEYAKCVNEVFSEWNRYGLDYEST